ncbi:hypothetical protein [Fibrella aquatilis]|uniref:Uncharacterized protein n=1 Tax=Fibrella aquatilis TaxID=2817059 RepID=A0A939GAT1_9BACT|nr:hypothetical protein [Fibrella aquatilis]MBO0932943.1 hypothetical protein [Fibrella aquatilis]
MSLSITRPRQIWPTLLGILLLALPVLVWLYVLQRYAVNVVMFDDYALLRFITHWANPATSWATRLSELLAVHNTHYIIYDRLVALATYYATGHINFLAMIVLGNAALLGIVWRLWTLFRELNLPVWAFLPVPCWVLSLQSHENMFWAMAGLQNFTVVWFVLESLYQLHRRQSLALPLGLGVAAVLTSGNGVLAFLVGSLVLLHQRRRGANGLIWWGITALVMLVRLTILPVNEHKTPFMNWIPNTFLSLGSGMTNQDARLLPMLAGVGLGGLLGLALLAWLFGLGNVGKRLQQQSTTNVLMAFAVVILATCLLLAIYRPTEDILRDRYKIYAHLALSVAYLLALSVMKRSWVRGLAAGVAAGAVAMNVAAFHASMPAVVAAHQLRQADAYNFHFYQTVVPLPYFRGPLDSLLLEAKQRDTYQFPVAFIPPTTWPTIALISPVSIRIAPDLTVNNSMIGFHPNVVNISQPTVPRVPEGPGGRGTYVVIEASDGKRFLMPATPAKSGFRHFLTSGELFHPGLSAGIFAKRFTPGSYRVKVLQVTDRTPRLYDTGQQLQIDGVN